MCPSQQRGLAPPYSSPPSPPWWVAGPALQHRRSAAVAASDAASVQQQQQVELSCGEAAGLCPSVAICWWCAQKVGDHYLWAIHYQADRSGFTAFHQMILDIFSFFSTVVCVGCPGRYLPAMTQDKWNVGACVVRGSLVITHRQLLSKKRRELFVCIEPDIDFQILN